VRVMVTGGAGFIGAHTVRALLDAGHVVTACDSFSDYYSPVMKLQRVDAVIERDAHVHTLAVHDPKMFTAFVEKYEPHVIVHLAAQPGVRLSITDPGPYLRDNIDATWTVLMTAARYDIPVLYASSSSVYGDTAGVLTEGQALNPPRSLYAATKTAGELFAQTLEHTHGLSSRALRLFTVYGPWGRPDMAVLQWANAILQNQPIVATASASQTRDLTYITDVTDAIVQLVNITPVGAEVVNVGGGHPQKLGDVVRAIRRTLNADVEVTWTSQHTGDVAHTYADPTHLTELGVTPPHTPLQVGIDTTVTWAVENKTGLATWCKTIKR
jgi:UDP-glucuronate 4-epimerase